MKVRKTTDLKSYKEVLKVVDYEGGALLTEKGNAKYVLLNFKTYNYLVSLLDYPERFDSFDKSFSYDESNDTKQFLPNEYFNQDIFFDMLENSDEQDSFNTDAIEPIYSNQFTYFRHIDDKTEEDDCEIKA